LDWEAQFPGAGGEACGLAGHSTHRLPWRARHRSSSSSSSRILMSARKF